MGLAETWWKIERSLPEDWKEAHLRLRLDDDTYAERAAALLGPANPVRSGDAITLYTARHGSGVAPKAVARLLTLLDEEGVRAELELASLAHGETPSADEERWLVDSWDELVAGLPEDWSDLYAEIDLDSSDYLDPGALALAPLNPARFSEVTGFRFRCARRVGYGASPEMVRRCLERLDERGITGEVLALRSLSDTKTVSTQGPVWYVGGRSV